MPAASLIGAHINIILLFQTVFMIWNLSIRIAKKRGFFLKNKFCKEMLKKSILKFLRMCEFISLLLSYSRFSNQTFHVSSFCVWTFWCCHNEGWKRPAQLLRRVWPRSSGHQVEKRWPHPRLGHGWQEAATPQWLSVDPEHISFETP